MNTLKWLRDNILASIITGVIVFTTTYYWDDYTNRTKHLYYEVNNTGNLLSPVQGQTELTYNKRKIDNIGSIRVKVYNQDDLELDNITFSFVVVGKMPLHIHYMDYFDTDGKKKRVKANYPIPPTDTVTSNEFTYTLTPLNKTKKSVFELLINLEDVDNVTVEMSMQEKGIEPQQFVSDTSKSFIEERWFHLLPSILVVLISLFAFLLGKRNRILQDKEIKAIREEDAAAIKAEFKNFIDNTYNKG